jgi:hypothetical protein
LRRTAKFLNLFGICMEGTLRIPNFINSEYAQDIKLAQKFLGAKISAKLLRGRL